MCTHLALPVISVRDIVLANRPHIHLRVWVRVRVRDRFRVRVRLGVRVRVRIRVRVRLRVYTIPLALQGVPLNLIDRVPVLLLLQY